MLKNVDENVEIDAEMVKIKVGGFCFQVYHFEHRVLIFGGARTDRCMPLTLSKMRWKSGMILSKLCGPSLKMARSSHSVTDREGAKEIM